MHAAGRSGGRRGDQDDRGNGSGGRAASAAGGVLGAPRAPVRLLHAGHDHGFGRPAATQPEPDRGRGARGARRQSLPLYGLPQHRQGGPGRLRGMSATDAPAAPWVGQAIKRKEDPRLIMGRARYIDDINVTGQLWAAFVRSPEAHAKIVSIDTSAAKEYPGVHAVYTGTEVDLEAPLPMAWVPPGIEVNNPPHWAL